MSFCRWLTKLERQTDRIAADQEYALPTEAQWEYACRGGSRGTKLFSFGDNGEDLKMYGNVMDLEFAKRLTIPSGASIKVSDGYVFTAPVGEYKPNDFGLYDMHGNVLEWCLDDYDGKSYSQRAGETKDPVVSAGGSYRVDRGGSWSSAPMGCRSAGRFRYSPKFRILDLGFRVVLQSVR